MSILSIFKLKKQRSRKVKFSLSIFPGRGFSREVWPPGVTVSDVRNRHCKGTSWTMVLNGQTLKLDDEIHTYLRDGDELFLIGTPKGSGPIPGFPIKTNGRIYTAGSPYNGYPAE